MIKYGIFLILYLSVINLYVCMGGLDVCFINFMNCLYVFRMLVEICLWYFLFSLLVFREKSY